MDKQVMDSITSNYQAIEDFVRKNGGAQPGSVMVSILTCGLLSKIIEQNDTLIGLLTGQKIKPQISEPIIQEKIHVDKYAKARFVVDNMFKNGEERKDSDILAILKENNVEIPIQELIDNKILHKTKRYMCRKR